MDGDRCPPMGIDEVTAPPLWSVAERIAARDPDRQTAEIHIRVALINRFNALGTA